MEHQATTINNYDTVNCVLRSFGQKGRLVLGMTRVLTSLPYCFPDSMGETTASLRTQ